MLMGSPFTTFRCGLLHMRTVLITSFWLAVSAQACTLDTRPTLVGNESGLTDCVGGGDTCDSGTSSSTAPDDIQMSVDTSRGVVTGTGSNVDGGVGMGGMSNTEPGMSSTAVDAGGPPPPPAKKPDGESCDVASDCVSAHCLHNICCAGGDCCRSAADCPMTVVDGIQLACNDPSTCQGKGGEVRCENFLCVAQGDIPDDSACTSEHMAKECGPYKPVFCNGVKEQTAPECPTSCSGDDACIEGAHCDASSQCVMDTDDGGQCSVDHDCASEHCDRGVCCASGDCCVNEVMCLKYNSPAMCVEPETCTGTVKVAVCKAFQCTNEERPSLVACDDRVVEECGLYPDVVCRGGIRAPCPRSCRVDSQCKAGQAYCKATPQGNMCAPKLPDGSACTSTSQCQNSCNHDFCCADTDPDSYCCGTDDDCAVLNATGCVDDVNSCQGWRTTATCTAEHRCRVLRRPDGNACTTREVSCGPGYRSQSAMCPLGCGCQGPTQCAAGYVCEKSGENGVCVPDPAQGASGAGAPIAPPRPGSAGAAAL